MFNYKLCQLNKPFAVLVRAPFINAFFKFILDVKLSEKLKLNL